MRSGRIHYGWIVTLASAGIMATCSLSVYTFGVFLEPLLEHFRWDRGPLSLAPSIAYLVAGFLAIATGKLSDRYGPRILASVGGVMMGAAFMLMTQVSTLRDAYIFWGLFMGLAFGCFIAPLVSTIPRWFVQKRGMAVGILATGFGLGAVISPLLAQMLISAYDWRKAFLILGVIAWAIILPLAQLVRKSPAQVGLRPYGEHDDGQDQAGEVAVEGLSLGQAVRGISFWLYGAIGFLWFFSLQAIVVHIVPHATASGITEIAAASILSIMAGCSVISRASIGFIADRLGARRTLSLCLILSTLAFAWLIFAQEIWAFYIFAIAFGLAYGGVIPLATLVPAELFGTRSLGMVIGGLMLYNTIGGAGGAPFAGYVYDTTQSYRVVLPVLFAVSVITAVLGVILLKYRGRPGHDT
ncbi:MAG: MFS transporter [Dehalococcoidia bacterium]|nr:MFS transporter [Dehalococcoidia bacterium]